jgi:hypothetical protein
MKRRDCDFCDSFDYPERKDCDFCDFCDYPDEKKGL